MEDCASLQNPSPYTKDSERTHVDATALLEEGSNGLAGSLWRDEDDVDVCRRYDASVVLVDDGEAVREVEGLVFGDEGLDVVPGLRLSGVGQEVHDDGALLESFFDGEERLAGHLCQSSVRTARIRSER